MRAGAITLGLRSARFCYVPSDYYDRELEARRVLLGASSTDLLCKTVIVENRKWEAVKAQGPVTDATTASARGRFFAVVLQYAPCPNHAHCVYFWLG